MKTNIFTLLLSLGFFLNLTTALFGRPAKPSKDAFYKAPANLSDYKEGEIMKWRQSPSKIRSLLYPINIEGSWQFMVKSTNSQGEPVGIVGSILKPYNANPNKILGYSFFEDSVNINCASSYAILFRGGFESVGTQVESIYMNAALAKGWYVLVTDYQGPKSAFGAGKLAGMATLDAMRATLKSGEHTGIKTDAKIALWGFSGGTVPSSWAGALQPSYAPDLSENLIGIAIGGWVTNITSVMETIDGTVEAGLVGAGVLGLASEYPEVGDKIYDYMQPRKVKKAKGLYNKCLLASLLTFRKVNWFKGKSPIFKEGMKLLEKPEIKHMLDENTLALNQDSPMPNVPLFVYHGKPDETVPLENSQRVYDAWCEKNIGSMELAISETSGHTGEFFEGGGAAFQWIVDRFDGKAPIEGCKSETRKSNLKYPGAGEGFNTIVRTTLQGVFQKKLGPVAKLLPKFLFKTFDTTLQKIDEAIEKPNEKVEEPKENDEKLVEANNNEDVVEEPQDNEDIEESKEYKEALEEATQAEEEDVAQE